MLRQFLIGFRANLSAGARLALMRRVSALDFRISIGQLIAFAVFGGLCASLVDLSTLAGAIQFNPDGVGGHVRDTAVLVLLCWGVTLALRAPGAALSLPVVLLAAGWLPDVAFATMLSVESLLGLRSQTVSTAIWWVILIWSWVVAWRAVAVVLQGRGRYAPPVRAIAVFTIFGGMIALALLAPSPRLWVLQPPAEEQFDPDGAPLLHVESEEVLAIQPRILFEALTSLGRREPGTTNHYFVGFAGDASQDVFRNDMEGAQDMADERLGTAGRSLTLINSRRTLLDAPIATMTNLHAALTTIGRLIDPEEDVVILYLSSHGSQNHQLLVNFPPLILQQITPTALSRTLKDARIKWKVVIVSACYSGGYIAPLNDPYTMVITSSRADRTSFGCDNKSEFTYFGQAFFQEALKRTTSLTEAFDMAKAAIAERERAEGLTPSEPQISIGAAIRDKLGAKAKANAGRVASMWTTIFAFAGTSR